MSDLIFLQPQGIIVFPLFHHSSFSELALQSLLVLAKNLNLQKSCTHIEEELPVQRQWENSHRGLLSMNIFMYIAKLKQTI